MIDKLRSARLARGWTQRALADVAGLDPQTVKRLEAGIGSAANLAAVMDALNFVLVGLGKGNTLAEQLASRRKARGLTLGQVAARSGLSRATIAGLERGCGSAASMIRLIETIAPGARRRAPERAYWGQGEKIDRDSRFTPSSFMAAVYEAFGEIDLDPCGHELSPVAAHRRILPSEGGDGLAEPWSGRLVYLNPPFSQMLVWLRRAHEQWRSGNVTKIVGLVPVRTDSSWFHDVLSVDADIFLLKGRVAFTDPRGRSQPTPFSLMVFALGADTAERTRFAELVPGFWMSRRQMSTTRCK